MLLTLPTRNDAGGTLAGVERMRALFAPRLNRAALLELAPVPSRRTAQLHVLRNHAVEHALGALPNLLSPWAVDVAVSFGAYDDTLSTPDIAADAAVLVWMDFLRFRLDVTGEEFAAWFGSRIAALREVTRGAIIVVGAIQPDGSALPAPRLRAAVESVSGAEFVDLAPVCQRVGVTRVFDARAARLSGTPFAAAFLLESVRSLAAGALARACGIGVKAIVCDLDHTLYDGVLGEDGAAGVVLPPARRKLQERLRALGERGVLLAVLSRNTAEDVAALFAARRDFPLRAADFAVIDASWDAKSEGLGRILAQLRVAPEAVLVLDDNLGELTDITQTWPETHGVPADDPEIAAAALEFFPGIEGFNAGANRESTLRAADLRANAERTSLARSGAAGDYFAALGMELSFRLNAPADLERVAELSAKTNQFNLTLARLTSAEVQKLAAQPGGFVLAVSLRDRLSDSGTIASWCGLRSGHQLCTYDLVISCRALGRQVEDILLAEAFRFVARALGATEIALPWREGPRNAPALKWLAQALGATPATSPATLPVPESHAQARFVTFHHSTHAP